MSDPDLHSPTATLEAGPAEIEKEAQHRRRMTLNMGPQHPSTHGVLRVLLELDGETVTRAYPDIGFLHTGIEKQCETRTWQQVVPIRAGDRLRSEEHTSELQSLRHLVCRL